MKKILGIKKLILVVVFIGCVLPVLNVQADVTAGNYHALLLSGGGDPSMNHTAFRNDLAFMFHTLKNNYQYLPEQIHVLCSDGTNPAPDQSDGTNSDPDLDEDGIDDVDYAATRSNLEAVFQQLGQSLTENDELVIFVTAPFVSGSNSDFHLWGEIMAAGDFGDLVATLNVGVSAAIWVSDQAQNFLNVIPVTIRAGAAKSGQTASLCDSEGDYHEYTWHFVSALNWSTPSGQMVFPEKRPPDQVELERIDAICSFWEAWKYTIENESTPEEPYQNDSPEWPGITSNYSLFTVPNNFDFTFCHEENYVERVHYYLYPHIEVADVLFVLDLTSSMGEELTSVQQNILQILNNLLNHINILKFGLVVLADYDADYNYCGYSDTYGFPGDVPYLLKHNLTNNKLEFRDTILELSLMNGGDNPESYGRALWEILHDDTILYTEYAQKVIILIGDNIPHDCDINEEWTPTKTKNPKRFAASKKRFMQQSKRDVLSTGIDPGRDGQTGTGDDIDFHDVLQEYVDNDVLILNLFSGQEEYVGHWEYWAEATGGASFRLENASQIPGAIDQLIYLVASYLDECKLYEWPDNGYITSVSPPDYNGLQLPAPVIFDINYWMDPEMLCGDYQFDVLMVGDGQVYGGQTVHINVPEDVCDCPYTPTPTATGTITPTPTRTATPPPPPTWTPPSTWTPISTFTPMFSPTPSPVPTSACPETGAAIEMPSDYYRPGEPCYVNVIVCNNEGHVLEDHPLFVVLDVFGAYFFAPGFSQTMDHYGDIYPFLNIGETIVVVLPEFRWPAGVGSVGGVKWYAGILNPEITEIVGEFDQFTFGWGN